MDYQQSRAYIEDAKQYGSVLGLDNMKEMMGRLGNPQDQVKYVHVAGTNGKGSVIAYLYSTLSKAGYRIGRYISPAIYSYRERMEIAGVPVSREKFAGYVTRIADVIENMTRANLPHPTPFEIETAVAFLFFAEEKCDLVLMEVGMGGDLDATNIIRNVLVAVLASIGLDHQEFLGKSLAEIAEKKAGIIKPGCEVVSAVQEKDAEKMISAQAEKLGVQVHVPAMQNLHVETDCFREQSFCYDEVVYQIPLLGPHQIGNACVALEVLKVLNRKGFPTTTEQRRQGLKETIWAGRFSVIHNHPLMIVDGAHNPPAAKALANSLETYFKNRKIYFIMGMFKDKDYNKVLEIMCPYACKIFTIETPDNPRALPSEELASAALKWHPDVEAQKCMEDAVEKAFGCAGKEDMILAFGSLSFIGELTRIVKKREDE